MDHLVGGYPLSPWKEIPWRPLYAELPNKLVSSADRVDYAYRHAGEGEVPLVLLQPFHGDLDSWDPALVDALAANRRVTAFDNAGV